MFGKKNILILTVTVLVLIFLGLTVAFLTRKSDVKLQNKTEEVVKRADYTNVARKTLDWIDQQRNESGWYILGKTCGQQDCERVEDDVSLGNKDGLIATWARLNFFEQHGDAKDLEIVKKDIDIFWDKYKDDNLKDSLWICKITYEMAQSKHLDQAQKDKLKELCLKKEIISFDNDAWKREKNNLIKNNDFNKGMSFPYYFLVFHGIYPNFGNVSDIYYKYKFTNSLSYFRTAKEELAQMTDSINSEIGVSNQCLIGTGALDLFRLSKSKDNLDYAITIYNKVKEDEQTVFVPFCNFLIKELYVVTNDNQYLINLEKNNSALVENYNLYNLDSFLVSPNTYPKRDVIMNGLFVEIIR